MQQSTTTHTKQCIIDNVFNANAIIMLPRNVEGHPDSKADVNMTGDKKLPQELAGDASTEAGVSALSISPSGRNATIVGSIFNSSSGENSAFRPKEESKAAT